MVIGLVFCSIWRRVIHLGEYVKYINMVKVLGEGDSNVIH